MALIGDAEMRLKHFKTLWQFCYPRAKLLITGRPNFFLDEEEMKAALGISKPMGDRPYCEAIRLAPFQITHIHKALRECATHVRDQICTLAKHNVRFFDLVSRPSLLHIVSTLWDREHLREKVDQLSSAYIMELFVRHSYRRQGLKEADAPEFMALTTAERAYIMNGIAAYMAAKRLSNQITTSQLNRLVEDLIEDMPDAVSSQSSALSGETTVPLRIRLRNTEHGIEHVKTDVRACGLLVDDPSAPGTFRFGHKSFMEYLFAAIVSERLLCGEACNAKTIFKSASAKVEDILSMQVSMDFLAELIDMERTKYVQGKQGSDIYLANTLLNTIIGGSRLAVAWQRFNLFNDCILRFLAEKSKVVGKTNSTGLFLFIVLSFSSSPALLGSLSVLTMIGLLSLPIHYHGNYIPSLWLEFSLILCLFGGVFAGRLSNRTSTSSAKLRLWYIICRTIGISDVVMHRVVGTRIHPLINKLQFEAIIKTQSSEDESTTVKAIE